MKQIKSKNNILLVSFVLLAGFFSPVRSLTETDAENDAHTTTHAERAKVSESLSEEIDHILVARWQENGIRPFPAASPEDWVRRAYLDVIGRTPSLAEIKSFLSAPAETRQKQVCDKLIDSDEYATYLAMQWNALLLNRSENEDMGTKGRLNSQLYSTLGLEALLKNTDFDFTKVLKTLFTRDTSPVTKNDIKTKESLKEFEKQMYIHNHGGNIDEKVKAREGIFDWFPLTHKMTTAFIGMSVSCVQCHANAMRRNKPPYQSDFWGIDTAFRNLEYYGDTTTDLNVTGKMVYENKRARDNVQHEITPSYFGTPLKMEMKNGRRDFRGTLADAMGRDPRFSKNLANRVWEQLFGLPLNAPHTVEDLVENEVKIPELLDLLAKAADKNGHSPKELTRAICKTNAYALTSRVSEEQSAEEPVYFNRVLSKPMTIEQMDLTLAHLQGVDRNSSSHAKTIQELFLYNYSPNIPADRSEHGVTVQGALLMLNSEAIKATVGEIGDKLLSGEGKNLETQIDDAYLTIVGEKPPEKLRASIASTLSKQGTRKEAIDDLVSVLINSSAFHLYP